MYCRWLSSSRSVPRSWILTVKWGFQPPFSWSHPLMSMLIVCSYANFLPASRARSVSRSMLRNSERGRFRRRRMARVRSGNQTDISG